MVFKEWCKIIDTEEGKVVLMIVEDKVAFQLSVSFNLINFEVITFSIELGEKKKEAFKTLKSIKKKHITASIKEVQSHLFNQALLHTNTKTTD